MKHYQVKSRVMNNESKILIFASPIGTINFSNAEEAFVFKPDDQGKIALKVMRNKQKFGQPDAFDTILDSSSTTRFGTSHAQISFQALQRSHNNCEITIIYGLMIDQSLLATTSCSHEKTSILLHTDPHFDQQYFSVLGFFELPMEAIVPVGLYCHQKNEGNISGRLFMNPSENVLTTNRVDETWRLRIEKFQSSYCEYFYKKLMETPINHKERIELEQIKIEWHPFRIHSSHRQFQEKLSFFNNEEKGNDVYFHFDEQPSPIKK